MRLIYGERRARLIESLCEQMPAGLNVTGGEAGMHVAVTLDDIDDIKVSERAAGRKLWLWPLSPCYAGESRRQGFILGFGSVSAEEIPQAVRQLCGVIKEGWTTVKNQKILRPRLSVT
jgi:GntR family transcriptional regulator/MocR family aminotransferase